MTWKRNKKTTRRISIDKVSYNQLKRITLLGRNLMDELGSGKSSFINYEKSMALYQDIRVMKAYKAGYKKALNVQQNVQQKNINHDNDIIKKVSVAR